MSVPRGRIKAMVDLLTDRQAAALRVILKAMLRQAGKIPPGQGAEEEPEEGCAAPGGTGLQEMEAVLTAPAGVASSSLIPKAVIQ